MIHNVCVSCVLWLRTHVSHDTVYSIGQGRQGDVRVTAKHIITDNMHPAFGMYWKARLSHQATLLTDGRDRHAIVIRSSTDTNAFPLSTILRSIPHPYEGKGRINKQVKKQ